VTIVDFLCRGKILLSACLVAQIFLLSWSPCLALEKATKTDKPALQGSVFQNELIDQLESLGIKCAIQTGAKPVTHVESVRLGSKAFYNNVDVGDTILGTRAANDIFYLKIQRQGQTYEIPFNGIPLKPVADPTKPVPQLTVVPKPIPVPQLPIVTDEQKKAKLLAQYDIDLIIDISGSMSLIDGTDGVSKFEWCHRQVHDLATRLAPFKKTLDITTFNFAHSTEVDCNPARVEQVYAETQPVGGTDMVDPLNDRMTQVTSKLGTGKKALIAVITDGLPNMPKDTKVVDQAIIDFTQTMHNQDDVVIAFFQIGDTFDGGSFCENLDTNLVSEGARYDIVTTQNFAKLKQHGLTNSLVDALVDTKMAQSTASVGTGIRSGGIVIPTSGDAASQRRMIERQLLGK
jgi:hypothetical protein